MKVIPALSILLLAALLAACAGFGSDTRYLDAAVAKDLALPPDLSEAKEESSFELPTGFSGSADSTQDEVPVLASVESLRLEGSGGDVYWLNVDEPADNLYQLVKNFWLSEGYRLAVDEPIIGIMQTEWVLTEQGASKAGLPWYQKLFSTDDLSASQDQFRTRIELDRNEQSSRIYIAHRGTEYVYVLEGDDAQAQGTDDDNQWRFRQPEPELEVEMLSRLMIYLGLQKAEVEQQVADVKLFSPRASKHIDSSERSPFLIVKDPYQIAWNRVYHQLERMNFEIESAEFESGLLGEGVIRINAQVSEGEKDKGFFSFFSTSSEAVKKQIVLVLAEETNELTRVIIETNDGDFDTSPEGAAFLDLLYQKIR